MNVLVTGGCGFIGRWVVRKLISDGHLVYVIDNLSNSDKSNLIDITPIDNFKGLFVADIKDANEIREIFKNNFDMCFHLAANINVQNSIDTPQNTFENDVIGTFNILEECRKNKVKLVFISTCMVYERCFNEEGIIETHPLKPASPYAASKISGENLILSYYYSYKLPVLIIRPFNTYGPYQKANGEGGVVAIFILKKLLGDHLTIYGNGTQTRDLLYVEDCANFIVESGYSKKGEGQIFNVGTGKDITINQLAEKIACDRRLIKHIPHIHPQSEIQKLMCNYDKAKRIFDWKPEIDMSEGIRRTEEWLMAEIKTR
ncbi:dTDP-glucose 4,6-dehydratase [Chlamydiota bacterium]